MVNFLCSDTGGQPGKIVFTWIFIICMSKIVEPKVIQIHWNPSDTVFQVRFLLFLLQSRNKVLIFLNFNLFKNSILIQNVIQLYKVRGFLSKA